MRGSGLIALTLLALSGCGRLGFEALQLQAGDAGPDDAGLREDSGAGSLDAAAMPADAGGVDAAGLVMDAGSATDAAQTDASSTLDAGDAQLPDDASSTLDAGDAAIDRCGNGTLDTPEQCDDGVESASCDTDCTFAACGDGVLNPSAGEVCDDASDPASCNPACQPQSCRAGCTCEWYGGARYMLCAEQLDYASAQSACSGDAMWVVRIESAPEQTWLRFRTLQEGFMKFHVGASDLALEGTWVWDDGTPFWQGVANGTPIDGEFNAWYAGEPNSFFVDENCSEVERLRGWNDCVCNLAKPVVCKARSVTGPGCGDGAVEAGEACDAGGESAGCDTDCSLPVCGDGVVNAASGEVCDDAGATGGGDYCSSDCGTWQCPAGCSCFPAGAQTYALCSTARDFQSAAIECGRAGMMLARVADATVDTELRTRADQASLGALWIGGFDLEQPDAWVWSDLSPLWNGTASGTAQAYEHFANGTPTGMANRDCLTLLANGEWRDADCTSARPYVCQRL